MLRDTKISEDLELELNKEMPKHQFVVPNDPNKKDMTNALTAFFNGLCGKYGNYVSTENALVYRSLSIVDGYSQDVICLRLIQSGVEHFLGNSSSLNVTDTTIAFGKRTNLWGQASVQRTLLAMGVPMLPFDAFTQAGLKLTSTKIIDQSGSEQVKRIVKTDSKGKHTFESIHFTGASLFQCGDKTFLFDIDRVEIESCIFNPFIVELGSPSTSIAQAYDDLIPLEVKTAKVLGQPVLRQGEYFFIKMMSFDFLTPDKEVRSWNDNKLINVEARLQVQGSRAHIASMFNKDSGFVSGLVKHQGREHKDLDLTHGWFKVVPNTAVRAFTITGDVD